MRKTRSAFGIAIAVALTGAIAQTSVAQGASGAPTIDPCTTPAVNVSGDIIWGDTAHAPLTTDTDSGEHIRDFVYLSTMEADDDRLDGATTGTIDWDFYQAGRSAERPGTNRGTFRIDNAEGTWEGPWTGIGAALDSWRAVVELVGSGAYEGLSAILFTHAGETGPIAGVIYPTDIASCDFSTMG